MYAGVMVPRAIPSQTDEPTALTAFIPTTAGTKWVYQTTVSFRGQVGREEETHLIIDAHDEGDSRIATILQSGGVGFSSLPQRRQLKVSGDGVQSRTFRSRPWRGREVDEEPIPWRVMFPGSLSAGTTWVVDHQDERSRHSFTVNGWEAVHVPAGAYRAVRVDYAITEQNSSGTVAGRLPGAVWISPGIGLVKFELSSDFVPYKLTMELKSFSTPAR